jgi:hypothetical protein
MAKKPRPPPATAPYRSFFEVPPAEARRLAAWLNRAATWVEEQKKK